MKEYTRVCARVDLDAIEYNMNRMKQTLREGVRMVAVLKTDGYGHGAIPIARMFEEKDYVWGYALATAEEALSLRKAGIKKPMLVLGCVFPEHYVEMIHEEIRITIYQEECLRQVAEIAERIGKKAYVHVKIDTGMSRLGYPVREESVKEIAAFSKHPNIILEGMFTHFAKADEIDKAYTRRQIDGYLWMKDALEKEAVSFGCYHCSNSAGIIDLPDANMDLVRAGVSIYGMYPSEEVIKENVPLKPALELISHVAYVRWLEKGTSISYGGTYVTDKRTKVAVVPVGYGDGYPRSLSNKGYVLIGGKKANILGRVCMDQFMVDVTDIDDVKYKDRVVLIGSDGEERLPVETLSELSGRFNYEFVCDLGKRIPREYLRHGEVIQQIDDFG